MDHTPPARPRALIAATGVCMLEAVALTVIAVLYLVSAVQNDSTRAESLAAALFFLLLAAILAAAVWALWRGMPWGRGVVFTWQVLQLVVGLGLMGASALAVLGAMLAAAALAVAVLLLTRPVIAVTTQPPRWLR